MAAGSLQVRGQQIGSPLPLPPHLIWPPSCKAGAGACSFSLSFLVNPQPCSPPISFFCPVLTWTHFLLHQGDLFMPNRQYSIQCIWQTVRSLLAHSDHAAECNEQSLSHHCTMALATACGRPLSSSRLNSLSVPTCMAASLLVVPSSTERKCHVQACKHQKLSKPRYRQSCCCHEQCAKSLSAVCCLAVKRVM